MKKLLIIFVILNCKLFSQIAPDSSYVAPDKNAEYPGGYPVFFRTITSETTMDLPKTEGIGCHKLYIRFTVDSTGKTKNLCFVDHDGKKVVSETETEEIQSNLKNWEPAMKNGHYIAINYSVPMWIRHE